MIKIVNAVKTYDRGATAVHALRGVSLSVAEGDFVAIMGPSGSGKSTLLHILGLLDVPDSGEYNMFDREVQSLSDDALANLRNSVIGFVFQHFNLLSRATALENVMIPVLYSRHRPDPEQGKEMLGKVGLADRLTHKPNELSGGQQQRVAIARALINNPRLILADEPTGNLDSTSAQEIMEIIAGLNQQGLTVVMVTHEEDIARYARRIIHMRDGVIQKDEVNTFKLGAENEAPVIRDPLPFCHSRANGNPEDFSHGFPIESGMTNHSGHVTNNATFAMKLLCTKSTGPAAYSQDTRDGWAALAAGVLSNFKQACRALKANKVRSALSMTGMLIGVVAIIAVLAITQGATKTVEQMLTDLGSNLLIMRSAPPRYHGVIMSDGMPTRFTQDDTENIKKEMGEARRVTGIVYGRGQITYGGKNWTTRVVGAEPAYEQMHALTPIAGRFFTEEELNLKARVALIGLTVTRELFGDVNPLGKFVKINKINFQVIGVLSKESLDDSQSQNETVIIPLSTAMKRLLGRFFFDSIEIEIANLADLENSQKKTSELIIRTHQLPPSRWNSFTIDSMEKIIEFASKQGQIMAWVMAATAIIAMLVGGIGIMNIMLISVTERTREIGVRKAVGAKRRDILVQFLTEALVISIIGGLFGIAFGWLISFAFSALAGWPAIVTPLSIVVAVLFSAITGIIFGLWPARQASLLNPIDALRYE